MSTSEFESLVAEPITALLPVGTFFDSGNGERASVVATEESSIALDDGGWHSLSPAVACANRPKNVPGGRDTFTVQRSPHQAELARLMPVLAKSYADYPTRQAAVWIVTDDADFEGLGELVEGTNGTEGSRVIHEAEAAAAMQICDQAGINITKRAIWRDRARIVRALPISASQDLVGANTVRLRSKEPLRTRRLAAGPPCCSFVRGLDSFPARTAKAGGNLTTQRRGNIAAQLLRAGRLAGIAQPVRCPQQRG